MKDSKMKIFAAILAAGFLALGIATPASADPFYVKASAGVSLNTEVEGFSLEDNAVYGVAVGTAVGPVRVEVGADRINTGIMGLEANVNDFSATAYLDLPITENTGVFVGAGLDYLQAEASYYGYEFDQDGQGWHATAGVATRLSDRVIGEVAIRYLDADFDDFSGEHLGATVGVRVRI